MIEDEFVHHGGDVYQASQKYNIPLQQWIDLSTGVNPESYPIPNITASCWQKLPYTRQRLLQAAENYYKNSQLLPVSGIQSVISWLPILLKPYPVLLPTIGYQEYVHSWRMLLPEVSLSFYPSDDLEMAVEVINIALKKNPKQHLLVINPNNPTGIQFTTQQLKIWSQQLADQCYLIIDEAFIDITPNESVLVDEVLPNMIVLRSFGKFFGLAGIRLGFVFFYQTLRIQLQKILGPWYINGPAQEVAINALENHHWQQMTRETIVTNAEFTQKIFNPLMSSLALKKSFYGPFFATYWLATAQAHKIYNSFAYEGILLRLIPVSTEVALIRIGSLSQINTEKIKVLRKVVKDFYIKKD